MVQMVETNAGKHDRAIRLFRFLKELTELRTKTIRTLNNYDTVIWLDDIPREEGCFCAAWREDSNEAADNWLEVKKPRLIPPPTVPKDLEPWLDSKQVANSSLDYPELREHIIETRKYHDGAEDKTEQLVTVQLDECPEIKEIWERYVEKSWWPWAEKDKQLKLVQDIYTDLFSVYQKQQRLGEVFEVVLGLGLLVWKTPGGQEIYRHLVTAQASLDFDAARGIISVGPGSDGEKITMEQDMLEAAERPPANEQRAIEEQLQEIGEVWDKEPLYAALKSWIHSVSSRGIFQDNISPPTFIQTDAQPRICFAPALILRKRNERNLIYVFQEIINQLAQDNELPVGVKCLIDYVVDQEPNHDMDNIPAIAEDIYFPLLFNAEQQEIIRRLSSNHGILVQGPPGTGKSQTVANLVCHLLAQGKRVLVTSQAPRALKVLSRMIPKEITALCVSLLGYDRAALQGLEECVFGITEKQNRWDQQENRKKINVLEKQLDEARRNEAETLGKLRALREKETYIHTFQKGCYHGTLASIAIRLKKEEKDYSWIGTLSRSNTPSPLSNDETVELLRLLREINADRENRVQLTAVESSRIIEPADFSARVQDEKIALQKHKENETARAHSAYPFLVKAGGEWRKSLHEKLKELTTLYNKLLQYPRPWIRQATVDILSGQRNRWFDLWRYTEVQLEKIDALSEKAPNNVSGIDNINYDSLFADASALLQHFEAGRGLGFGPFRAKAVKNGIYLLQNVYVNGQLCNNKQSLATLLQWLEREKLLAGLYEHWQPFEEVVGPAILQVSTYKDFNSVISSIKFLCEKTNNIGTTISDIPEIMEPAWHDYQNVASFIEAIEAISSEEELHKTAKPFQLLGGILQDISLQENVHSVINQLLNATRQRDVQGYGEAYHVLCGLEKDIKELNTRDELLHRLELELPELVDSLSGSFRENMWDDRMASFEKAWYWAAANNWLQNKTDPAASERLNGELSYHQARIKRIMKQLVAAKAWGHFFDRLAEEQRQHLMAWAAAMRKIGAGTGKYTVQYRKNAREHMEQCRPAIPAWIMPIYRVAESINPRANAFDVVIMDEASQSGPEALFLHYLAPKIIVVGDDRQISPEHVGINREDVNILRERHIPDLPLNDLYSLEDSFFDQAVTRFGGRIRLKEHFRCMPEIIQFSNNICYHSEPLIPLRQRADSRLTPVKATHVPEGYRRGSGQKVDNPPEAVAIVEQITRCCQDPAYTDKSMGVISLQGEAQARLIEKYLLEKLGPEEMERRQLICGDAYAFQGDERDIIFLSLVAASDETTRIGTLSNSKAERRFNVAASRARDQMWLFHTATLNELSSKCFRYKLLEYCLNPKVEPITFEGEIINKDILVQPFDSLFEQHVFLKIRERGYRVVSQYNVAEYRIDLVVSGMQGQLAVECDGDRWHGSDQYEADMERQRQLERCKWTFWRIRASTFYRDPDRAMESLWSELERLKIYPTADKDTEKNTIKIQEPVEPEKDENKGGNMATPTQITMEPYRDNVIPLNKHRKTDIAEIRVDRLSHSEPRNYTTKEYVHWEQKALPDPRQAPARKVLDGLIDIISAEGPILVHRVFSLYLRGAGIGRRGGILKNILADSLQKGITGGLIAEANELKSHDKLCRTVRLPGTPETVLRTRGDRKLNEIPPAEIAGVMLIAHGSKNINMNDMETLFRYVLEYYGLIRMTKNALKILDAAFRIAHRKNRSEYL